MRTLLRQRPVQIGIAAWLAVNVALLAIAGGRLPFAASSLAEPPAYAQILLTNAMFIEIFALMALVHVLTRRRQSPDIADRMANPARAKRELAALLAYGIAAMGGGYVLARSLGWHAFGYHLDGMVIRTGQHVTPAETVSWATYNVIAYAVIPLLVFRRRYTTEQLNLRSADRKADLRLILIVLAVEATVQLLLTPSSILSLDPRQALVGGALSFTLSFAGTVLPTMVFVQCLLVPRYLRLTRSTAATVLLGGVTYALLHVFDGWTVFASPSTAALSTLYVLLFYTAPGMFKTFLTIRTANAWTHVWAYHAIVPHALIDAPMFVMIFGLR